MRRDFMKEREEMQQSFRLEIHMLECRRANLEVLLRKSQELIQDLQDQLQQVTRGPLPERADLGQCCMQALSGPAGLLAQEQDLLEQEQHQRHRTELPRVRSGAPSFQILHLVVLAKNPDLKFCQAACLES